MKTTKEIWEENIIEEPIIDEFGRERDVVRYFDNTNAKQKWCSKEEIIKALKTQKNKGMGNFNYFEFMDDLALLGGDELK